MDVPIQQNTVMAELHIYNILNERSVDIKVVQLYTERNMHAYLRSTLYSFTCNVGYQLIRQKSSLTVWQLKTHSGLNITCT